MKLDFIKKIVTSKIFHRVVCVLIILFIWYMVFSSGSICFADDWILDAETKIRNFNEIASEIIKIAYVFLWPLIFVCGITLDNSLVYGTWLHLDAPLWSLWNIMKNIANFALWFFVLYAILRNLLSAVGMEDKKWKPIEVIKKTLISWILIQMSRFLVAAIIDVSTILTYAVWWLPLTVLQTNPQYTNRPIMSLHINASSTTNGLDYDIYYTYWDHKISDCKIVDNFPLSWSYIVWAKTPYIWNAASDTWFYVDTWYCAVWWRPYRYKHVLSWETDGFFPNIYSITDTWDMLNKTYEIQLTQYTNNINSWTLDSLLKNCVIIPVDDAALYTWCHTWDSIYWALSLTWNDVFFGWQNENWLLYTIDNLIEQSKGYVWPLITIYSSLLDIQSFADIWSHTSYVEDFISLVFKLLFSLVLIAPLAWMAVVLVVRIWILWVVIAAAPVLILIWVFGDMLWWLSKALPKQLSVWNIIQLVFAPVIITLAISLSLIFINAISGINKSSVQRSEVFESLWIQESKTEKNTYSILWLVDIQLNTKLVNQWLDDFAYFITLLFATGIIRFFLAAAIKLCGTIWETMTDKWIWLWKDSKLKNFLTTVPIIPLPGWRWKVWIWAMHDIVGRVVDDTISANRDMSMKNLEENFPSLVSHGEKIAPEKAQTIMDTEIIPAIQRDPTITYESLSNQQRRALNTLYNWRESGKAEFDKLLSITKTGAELKEYTAVDALNYTRDQLDNAVRYDENWKKRASSMIWWAVHTSNGVYVVDIEKWTESTWNPQYKIVTREQYEEAHFWEPIKTVSKDEFTEWKNSNTERYSAMNKYLGNMKDQYDMLKKLEDDKNKEWLGQQELEEIKTQIKALEDLFTVDLKKKLAELDPEKFSDFNTKEEPKWEWN